MQSHCPLDIYTRATELLQAQVEKHIKEQIESPQGRHIDLQDRLQESDY
jgi:hypothetical protein